MNKLSENNLIIIIFIKLILFLKIRIKILNTPILIFINYLNALKT